MGEPEDLEFRFVNVRVQSLLLAYAVHVESLDADGCRTMGAMGRLRDFGRDAADYFGLGERSDGLPESSDDKEPWWHSALRVGALLPLAFLLREALGFEDDFVGFLAMLVIVAVLASVLGLGVRLVRGRRAEPKSPGANGRRWF
jgi:hypothetical protein